MYLYLIDFDININFNVYFSIQKSATSSAASILDSLALTMVSTTPDEQSQVFMVLGEDVSKSVVSQIHSKLMDTFLGSVTCIKELLPHHVIRLLSVVDHAQRRSEICGLSGESS